MSETDVIAIRILDVIREHYDETSGEIIAHNIRHVANDRTYIVYLCVAYESDDDYTIHTEVVRVDDNGLSGLEFTLLTEHDLQLKDEL
jgi:hypothetical protein